MLRKSSLLLSCCLISFAYALPSAPAAKQINQDDSWVTTALKLQREIDLDTPFNQATFIGTHNSYNSKAYEIPFVRYIDPNQLLSIYDQLNNGVRSVELDAHWTFDDKAQKAILLCHGRPDHVGCGIFDRPIEEGLQEIQAWLKANPNEVVLLYIERHLDGHEPRMAHYLKKYLGDFIYKPTHLSNHGWCNTIPGTITKNDVLKAGKQLLVVAKDCDGDNPNYEEQDQFSEKWSDYVFVGIGNMPTDTYTFLDDTITNFLPFPDCSKSNIFFPDPDHTSMWRIFEDRTHTTSIVRHEKKLEPADMVELMRCGINWPTMDMFDVADPRLAAAIWSWAPNYPQDNGGNCAIYQAGAGIENTNCDQTTQYGYVCMDETTQTEEIISTPGPWSQGEAMCQAMDKHWHFTVPVNGLQMEYIRESAAQAGINTLWLNYAVDDKSNWKANILKS